MNRNPKTWTPLLASPVQTLHQDIKKVKVNRNPKTWTPLLASPYDTLHQHLKTLGLPHPCKPSINMNRNSNARKVGREWRK